MTPDCSTIGSLVSSDFPTTGVSVADGNLLCYEEYRSDGPLFQHGDYRVTNSSAASGATGFTTPATVTGLNSTAVDELNMACLATPTTTTDIMENININVPMSKAKKRSGGGGSKRKKAVVRVWMKSLLWNIVFYKKSVNKQKENNNRMKTNR